VTDRRTDEHRITAYRAYAYALRGKKTVSAHLWLALYKLEIPTTQYNHDDDLIGKSMVAHGLIIRPNHVYVDGLKNLRIRLRINRTIQA